MAGEMNAIDIAEGMAFSALGVQGLGAWYAKKKQEGYDDVEIQSMVRYGTDKSEAGQAVYTEYLRVFPKMDKFLKEKRFIGANPEQQYMAYKQTVQEAAQRYGIMDSLVSDIEISKFIDSNNNALGIVNRMALAANAVATTPPEMLSTMRDYYGVNNGDLISFYLNPELTEPILQTRYTAAQIGTEAIRQQFGVSQVEAENLAQRGFDQADAQQAFQQAAQQQTFQQGLGETATRDEILSGVTGDVNAAKKLERIAQSRAGRFQEGGSYLTNQSGITGLGSSSTR